MPDSLPIEKLQPCLLDRLTDDEPDKKEERSAQRVISRAKYFQGVKRDLEWLFNTEAYLSVEGLETFNLRDYPEAFKSVINFGTRQLCGMVGPDMQRLQEELAAAVKTFEPRLSPKHLNIRADLDRNHLVFELEGELWANPLPEHLHIKTTLDLETGQCLLGDAPHG